MPSFAHHDDPAAMWFIASGLVTQASMDAHMALEHGHWKALRKAADREVGRDDSGGLDVLAHARQDADELAPFLLQGLAQFSATTLDPAKERKLMDAGLLGAIVDRIVNAPTKCIGFFVRPHGGRS